MRNVIISLFATSLIFSTPIVHAVPSKPDTHYYTLDNGLRLIVRPDHRAPVVVSQIWYQVGSSYEYEGITGISHMLEHLMFKGTQRYPKGFFDTMISENGGDLNAFTSLDYTVYYEELEARRLPIAFELESDRMQNLIFTEEDLITERDVVTEERRLRTEDNPVARMYERFNVVAQATSPYRYPIIGWMDDIVRYTRADVDTWYSTWYAPNNAIMVVVGDVEPETVLRLAEHYFGPIPASAKLPKDKIPTLKHPPQVPPLGERRIEATLQASVPYVYLGYNVPVVNTASENWEPYALDVLVGVLAGGESARLNRTLVRDQMLASEIGAAYNPFDRLDTLLMIGGTPSTQHTSLELEVAFRQQVAALQAGLIEPQELQRVKTQVIANEIYARDSLTQQALQMGSLASVGLSPELVDEYVNNINAVTAEQVQLVAQRYLTSERLTVGMLVPNSPAAPVEITPPPVPEVATPATEKAVAAKPVNQAKRVVAPKAANSTRPKSTSKPSNANRTRTTTTNQQERPL